ncbi:MAG: hypothetical protein H0U03_09015, partial [Actinobacteria bacterium]|nr:hypothetical protein [Actinomycetota bacterium]
GSAAGSHATTAPSWSGAFSIGGLAWDLAQYPFNGFLDEAAVYGRELSGSRVAAHFNAGRGT